MPNSTRCSTPRTAPDQPASLGAAAAGVVAGGGQGAVPAAGLRLADRLRGWGGPDQARAGYVLASFFGRTGIAHEITMSGAAPAPLMQGLGDTYTAMTMVPGILAALHRRTVTGRGQFVQASLLRTGMWALAGELGVAAMDGNPKPPAPREQCGTPMYNSNRAADGRWFYLVGVEAGRHLPRVLAAIGRSDLLKDEKFGSRGRSRRTAGSSSRSSTRPSRPNRWVGGGRSSTTTTPAEVPAGPGNRRLDRDRRPRTGRQADRIGQIPRSHSTVSPGRRRRPVTQVRGAHRGDPGEPRPFLTPFPATSTRRLATRIAGSATRPR